MTVKHEIKSQLAKLLATEDLIVEHKNVQTAQFEVRTRVLTLPNWDRASNNVYDSFFDSLVSGSISGSCDGIRNRIKNIQFNNTTELNSTIYFCRANHNEFNYSSNPTYLSESKLRVKNTSLDNPVSYITSVGLYSADNELLAVAKLSEPLKKTPETELTLRVRLDY